VKLWSRLFFFTINEVELFNFEILNVGLVSDEFFSISFVIAQHHSAFMSRIGQTGWTRDPTEGAYRILPRKRKKIPRKELNGKEKKWKR